MPSDPEPSGAEPGPLSEPSDSPPPAAASAASPCSTMSPAWNRIPRAISRQTGVLRREELQIHAEVLELLALRVAHDRARLGVRLNG